MKYLVKYENPHQRIVHIEFACPVTKPKTQIYLPAWRPGRYELGNFAKNLLKMEVLNKQEQPLPFKKVSKDQWEIITKNETEIKIVYSVFTPDFNAGACWIDPYQLYINGIHCFLYNPDLIDEPCQLQLSIPDNFITVIGLSNLDKNIYAAKSYHELVDSPFVCSPRLQKVALTVQQISFNIWFQGEVEISTEKLKTDFEKFIQTQINLFGSFVAKEYHFIFQITQYRHYHGVEHLTSTVITLGPADEIFGSLYNELLGVSCHELFHCWNIKTIRPAEMQPYRYQEENYSELGYVAEGVTTYYGDYLLLRSGVFDWKTFADCFNGWLNKYYENFGRLNMSVAASSFDTWLDGYVPGVPGRKVSIYNEGALCAFILDILIRQFSNNKNSLDDVMRELYNDFGKHQKGYTRQDYRKIAESKAGVALCDYFDNLINGVGDYTPYLENCLNYLGLEINKKENSNWIERYLGLKIIHDKEMLKIKSVAPKSPADKLKLIIDSHITKINQLLPIDFLKQASENLKNIAVVTLEVNYFGYTKCYEVVINTKETYFDTHQIILNSTASNEQNNNFKLWSNQTTVSKTSV